MNPLTIELLIDFLKEKGMPQWVNDVLPYSLSEATGLHYAAHGTTSRPGYAWVVEVLIGVGANLEAQTDQFSTPLHWAVDGDNISAARVLLQAGADVNAKDGSATTPLMRYNGKDPLMRQLLKRYGGTE